MRKCCHRPFMSSTQTRRVARRGDSREKLFRWWCHYVLIWLLLFSPGLRALLLHPVETQFNTKQCTPRAFTRPGGLSLWYVRTDDPGEWGRCVHVSPPRSERRFSVSVHFVIFMHVEKNILNQQILIWFVTPCESGLDCIHSAAIFLWRSIWEAKMLLWVQS